MIYIDKTKFIVQIIESKQSNLLLCRPRRTGKTLTASTLGYFCSYPCSKYRVKLITDAEKLTKITNFTEFMKFH